MAPAARKEYRSGFEKGLRERLDEADIPYGYETKSYPITLDAPGFCKECSSTDIARNSRYTPDFFFNVWVIEAKGKFTSRDRKRILAFVKGYPKVPFGILFMRDNYLTKKRHQRYSEWCEKNGIEWAVGWFKQEWMK